MGLLNEKDKCTVERRQASFKERFFFSYKKGQREFQLKTHALSSIYPFTEGWMHRNKPLAKLSVALEDQFVTPHTGSSGGYITMAPYRERGATADFLLRAGATIGIKANMPVTMMSLVGRNDVFGQPANFYNEKFSTGGSGIATLVAANHTPLGIGTDIWGGIRVPAAWNGVYALKMSSYRWPMAGTSCGYEGIKGILPVASPMARSVKDLRYFIESVFSEEPWKYDLEVEPRPWREVKLPERLGVRIMVFDFLPPTPAQARALQIVKDALNARGCGVGNFRVPLPFEEYDELIHKLYYADGFRKIMKNLVPGEDNDPHVAKVASYARIPRFLQIIWEKILHLFGYFELERMYRTQRSLSVSEYLDLLEKIDEIRQKFNETLKYCDFIITPPHPSPAVPIGTKNTFWTILYTSLFNLLDYPAGIVPVSKVDKELDRLPSDFDRSKLSFPAKVIFDVYDPVKMEGLPTAVQIVTPQHREEEALAAMEFVVESLENAGIIYEQPDAFN